ncbi:MAG: hypothetical protein Q8S13_09245 [Dehalococcoidia bacterium]|nr:hypothetical protein [Dehalococcoidia bacterium]
MASTSGSLGSSGATFEVTTDNPAAGVQGVGVGCVTFNLTGTFSLTLAFEATVDGSNWFTVAPFQMSANGVYAPLGAWGTASGDLALNAGAASAGITVIGSAAGNRTYAVPVYGYNKVRVRCTAYTSGMANIAADVAASSPVGQMHVNIEGVRASYSAATTATFATSISAADVFSIIGAASRTVRVTRMGISGVISAAAPGSYINVMVVLRSTANNSGTSENVSSVRHDLGQTVASATVVQYTSAPSNGVTAGIIASYYVLAPSSAGPTPSANTPMRIEVDFVTRSARAIVLRGTGNELSWFIGTNLATGFFLAAFAEWVEE